MRQLGLTAVMVLAIGYNAVHAASLPEAKPEELGFSQQGLARLDDFVAREIAAKRVPGAVIAIGDGTEAADGPDGQMVPLLRGRRPTGGYPTVSVCRNFTCRMPVSDLIELRGVLEYPADGPPDEQRLDSPVV